MTGEDLQQRTRTAYRWIIRLDWGGRFARGSVDAKEHQEPQCSNHMISYHLFVSCFVRIIVRISLDGAKLSLNIFYVFESWFEWFESVGSFKSFCLFFFVFVYFVVFLFHYFQFFFFFMFFCFFDFF